MQVNKLWQHLKLSFLKKPAKNKANRVSGPLKFIISVNPIVKRLSVTKKEYYVKFLKTVFHITKCDNFETDFLTGFTKKVL